MCHFLFAFINAKALFLRQSVIAGDFAKEQKILNDSKSCEETKLTLHSNTNFYVMCRECYDKDTEVKNSVEETLQVI